MLTPYAAAALVNAVLVDEGIKTIPPQMLYNYTTAKVNAHKKPLIKYSIEEGVDRDDLTRWVKAYVAKKKAGTVTHAPLNIHDDIEDALEAEELKQQNS